MSHFGALAAASSRYAALCGAPTDPRTLPWYWGRIPTQLSQDKSSPNGKKYNLNCSQITSFLYGFKKKRNYVRRFKLLYCSGQLYSNYINYILTNIENTVNGVPIRICTAYVD